MRVCLHRASIFGFLATMLLAINYFEISETPALAAENFGQELSGKWTYRSFHNNPALVTDDDKTALSIFFAEATFTFNVGADSLLTGALDWQGGGLDLQGTIEPGGPAGPLTVQIVGTGRPGTQTENWEYDYFGYLAHSWPNGVAQVPALVGSVLRAKPHNGAPAGYAASFIAVKQ
ncbi:hypothetical protein NKH71_20255 [Mesorhizobium sp. M0983]|uniref:hypothetical protein n=1 Tax=unclassified Mesorhizobium TaxID=325217 RepID=UPI00333945CE